MIRPIAIALVAHNDRLLLMRVKDADNGVGYRPLGGSIEFGEYGADTVVREFNEELGAAVANVSYIGTVESLFSYGGESKHEIVLMYSAELMDPGRYSEANELQLADDHCVAEWVSINDVLNELVPFFPGAALPLVRSVLEQHKQAPDGVDKPPG